MAKGKAPAMQFYVREWLSDPQLRQADPATRGIWIDLLCFMWDAPRRGIIQAEYSKLALMVAVKPEQLDFFIKEATELRFCDISVTDIALSQIVTITNRRMFREDIDRENNRLRQSRYRHRLSSAA